MSKLECIECVFKSSSTDMTSTLMGRKATDAVGNMYDHIFMIKSLIVMLIIGWRNGFEGYFATSVFISVGFNDQDVINLTHLTATHTHTALHLVNSCIIRHSAQVPPPLSCVSSRSSRVPPRPACEGTVLGRGRNERPWGPNGGLHRGLEDVRSFTVSNSMCFITADLIGSGVRI